MGLWRKSRRVNSGGCKPNQTRLPRLLRLRRIVMTMILMSFILLSPVLFSSQKSLAQEQPASGGKIQVRVDGLSCPFCAFGLEKKLKKLDGVLEVKLYVDKGLAEIRVEQGKTIPEEKIIKAVRDAGFTPREIRMVQE